MCLWTGCHLWAWSSLSCKIETLLGLNEIFTSGESLNGSYNYPLFSHLLIITYLSFSLEVFLNPTEGKVQESLLFVYKQGGQVLLMVHLMVTVGIFFFILMIAYCYCKLIDRHFCYIYGERAHNGTVVFLFVCFFQSERVRRESLIQLIVSYSWEAVSHSWVLRLHLVDSKEANSSLSMSDLGRVTYTFPFPVPVRQVEMTWDRFRQPWALTH